MTRLLGRAWLPLVIVVVIAVAGFSVDRIRTLFGVHRTTTIAGVFSRHHALEPQRSDLRNLRPARNCGGHQLSGS